MDNSVHTDSNRTFTCIIPTLPNDYADVHERLYSVLDMLPVSRIVFTGPEDLEAMIRENTGRSDIAERVEFINENDILPFSNVKKAYNTRLSEISAEFGKPDRASRSGWYYQQFLKMEYHRLCDDEYYMCWDADTIPLRKTEMFSPAGIPYLDTKQEFQQSYFETLYNLFGINKLIKQSFICEHMLFRTEYMSEMIAEIMSLPIKGDTFYEKIFSSVNRPFNGFSEFETYGSWVALRHPDAYRLRSWKSLRNAGFMIRRKDITDDDIRWLATGFDAVSFERYQEPEPILTELFRNPVYREKLPADIFYRELLEMGLFGEYRDDGIISDGNICPI